MNKRKLVSNFTTVAFVTSYALSLGNFRGPLIRELVGQGKTCLCLAPDFTSVTKAQVRELGGVPVDFSLSRVGLNPWRDLIDTWHLYRLLLRLAPDLMIAYFIKPVIFGSIAGALARVKNRVCLIEGLGTVFSRDPGVPKMRRQVLRWATKMAYAVALATVHLVFFCNEDDRRFFVRESPLLTDGRTILIPGIGVELNDFPAVPPVLSPVTFVMVGRMLLSKGVREFVAAAQTVKQQYPDTRFILVGDTDENPDSVHEDELARWVSDDLVEWTGQVADVRPWLATSSVVVLPSRYPEGLPRSLVEALASARAIITTDTPGCRETVIAGQNGFLVPVSQSDILAAAMQTFVEKPSMIASMGKRSRQIAEARFDVRKVNKLILAAMGIDNA